MRLTGFKKKGPQHFSPEERAKITVEKFQEIVEGANFGLAEYPILMTADILIFDGKFVPVGEDQLQHLEFARTLVRKFHSKFGKEFIEKKIRTAVTDSGSGVKYDPQNKTAISNLMMIYSELTRSVIPAKAGIQRA